MLSSLFISGVGSNMVKLLYAPPFVSSVLRCLLHTLTLSRVSLGTGKPLLLNDESFVRHARLLLSHPMASETDMRLIAGVELVNLRGQ